MPLPLLYMCDSPRSKRSTAATKPDQVFFSRSLAYSIQMLQSVKPTVGVRRYAARQPRTSRVCVRAAAPATESPAVAKFEQSGKDLQSLLREAAVTRSVDPELVEGALSALEKKSTDRSGMWMHGAMEYSCMHAHCHG